MSEGSSQGRSRSDRDRSAKSNATRPSPARAAQQPLDPWHQGYDHGGKGQGRGGAPSSSNGDTRANRDDVRNRRSRKRDSSSSSDSSRDDKKRKEDGAPVWFRDFCNDFKKSSAEMAKSQHNVLEELRGFKTEVCQRFEQAEQDLEEHTQQISQLDHKLAGALERLSLVENSVDIWNNRDDLPPPPRNDWAENDNDFDRAPRLHVVLVGASGKLFSSQRLKDLLGDMLQSADLDISHVNVGGKGVRKNFEVSFVGESGSRRAAQFLQSQQDEEGNWKSYYVVDPHGQNVQVFFGPDQSAKSKRVAVLTKAMARVVKTFVDSEQDVFAKKRDGEVTINWVPVVSLDVTGPKTLNILWNQPEVDRLGLDKAAVLDSFQAGGRKPIKWTASS